MAVNPLNESFSAGIENPTLGTESIGLSSEAPQRYRNWLGKKVTPHVLRHTAACHLLRAGVDMNTIRKWFGHADIATTNIYAEIDIEMKAKAIELADLVKSRPRQPWRGDKGLLFRLKDL